MKKLLLMISIFISINLSLSAASGFEALINVPLGISVGIPIGKIQGNTRKIDAGFDVGVTAQFGYVIDFKNKIGLSILGEAGYSYDTYSYSTSSNSDIKIVNSASFHSFQIGVLPKVNIKDFSIGVGGGLKIPIAGNSEERITKYGTNYTSSGSKMNTAEIVNKYDKMNIIPYIKLTFDYSVFNNYNIGANFGLYLNYEFGVRQKIYKKKYISTDSFGFGLQIGLRFSPFNTSQMKKDEL